MAEVQTLARRGWVATCGLVLNYGSVVCISLRQVHWLHAEAHAGSECDARTSGGGRAVGDPDGSVCLTHEGLRDPIAC